VIEAFVRETGVPGILFNGVASGTEIIARLGDEMKATGKPIIYTSTDSVFQIACDESVYPPEELYAMDLAGMRKVFLKQIEDLNDRATSLTADDAARLRALEYEIERIDAVQEMRKEFLPTDIQIVLTHSPLTREYVADLVSWGGKEDPFSMRYASLILAGHYNGGQWRLPFAGAIYVPELGWFPKDSLVQGLSYVEGIPQHISPGLGSDPHYEYMPGRVFNPPVMTRIVLTRKAN
jgi:predicted MPP superfamily phosphohydrolase